MMKKIILILLAGLLSMASCTKSEAPELAEAVTEETLAESIFQLSSDWESQNGERIKLEDLKGKTMVMAMIYTSCKTACPRLTAEMREIEQELGDYDPEKVRFVLVSIDPKVDTPEMMKKYLNNNKFDGQQWLFLRSDEASTREFANVLSVKYKQISPIDFSHSNIISVFSEDGVLEFQKEGLNPDVTEIVSEVQKLM